jgi:hypothetical protein
MVADGHGFLRRLREGREFAGTLRSRRRKGQAAADEVA